MPALKPMEIIKQLRALCRDVDLASHNGDENIMRFHGRQDFAREILGIINTWALDWETEQQMNKFAWDDAKKAIETDIRRDFDSAEAVLAHIYKIASKEPFLGNAKISLRAIEAFCGDYLNNHKKRVYQEQIKQATF